MIFLIDQNLEGYAEILLGAIASKGWLDLLPIQFITFAEIELLANSTDNTFGASQLVAQTTTPPMSDPPDCTPHLCPRLLQYLQHTPKIIQRSRL